MTSSSSENEAGVSNSSSDETRKKLTRKQRRQQQLLESHSQPVPELQSYDDITNLSITINRQLRSPQPASAMSSPVRLLVCSIGNPVPYLNTLHSAGHTILSSLAASLSYPPFLKSRAHGNGLLSSGAEYTLWQSTSFMNVSGPGVAAAWRQFVKENRGTGVSGQNGGTRVGLVVVHDELELAVGQVKVRSGGASAKGHNGLKSINGMGLGKEGMDGGYTRIGVGIGRPEGREPGVVAGYVLRKMTAVERGKIEGAVGGVERELRRLRGV